MFLRLKKGGDCRHHWRRWQDMTLTDGLSKTSPSSLLLPLSSIKPFPLSSCKRQNSCKRTRHPFFHANSLLKRFHCKKHLVRVERRCFTAGLCSAPSDCISAAIFGSSMHCMFCKNWNNSLTKCSFLMMWTLIMAVMVLRTIKKWENLWRFCPFLMRWTAGASQG